MAQGFVIPAGSDSFSHHDGYQLKPKLNMSMTAFEMTAFEMTPKVDEQSAQAKEIEQLKARIRSCSTMDEAEKIALVRMTQELANVIGIDPVASSPAAVVHAVRNHIEGLLALVADIKRWDVDQYVTLPLDLRRRIQAVLLGAE